jgi:hydrogenase maturation protein HypF
MLPATHHKDMITARHLKISGQVQGVGFRPFIYRIAIKHKLNGWVRNSIGIVEIHVQGVETNIQNFIKDIFDINPPLAKPELDSEQDATPDSFDSFTIKKSFVTEENKDSISVPTDLFLCDDCLCELNDPKDRRYHYPFINCTQCGPRYTLIKMLPYDRKNTTMADFKLCQDCLFEYENPLHRRFHAEPIACPSCGPSLSFHRGNLFIDDNHEALQHAITALKEGKVVAVKGIGGYHLMCDATNSQAIQYLRDKKPRPDKPLAIMFPAPVNNPFHHAEASVKLSEDDRAFLLQAARPILLLEKKPVITQQADGIKNSLAENVAPGLNEIGVMLPYSPLHHLLLDAFKKPLVATSANISGEPVLTDNDAVEKRLHHVCHAFLHHNRPIERPADDPVYRSIAGTNHPLRTGRGGAPIEISLPFRLDRPVLAVGAHMKNTITLAWNNRAVISPHIGEMNSIRSIQVFETSIADLQKLYGVQAEVIICDAHPGYTTSHWANKQNLPLHTVLHHHAHASAAYYENIPAEGSIGKCDTDKNQRELIVFSWDGTGYGDDGTLWGGETFVGRPGHWIRRASMRPFYLPGGDKAGREPWRSAAAMCWEAGQDYDNIPQKDPLLKKAWRKRINTPQSSSVGRLFDAAAALTGIRTIASFEGQGPMELEAICSDIKNHTDDFIGLNLNDVNDLWLSDWAPLISAMLDETIKVSERAVIFHNSMSRVILQQALKLRDLYAINTVSLSGGVFQNRILTERAIQLLTENNFHISFPELIPVNDAGISFGQVMEYGFRRSE